MSLKDLLNRVAGRRRGLSIHHPADHPEQCVEGIPDFVEPLRGWRAWRIRTPLSGSDSCPAFSSVILETAWTPRRWFLAEHSFDLGVNCRGLLDPCCSCGIYAFRDPLEAFVYSMRVRDRLFGMSVEVALGTVSLWGRVIECESGYKAQYAYPRHIYLPASFVRFLPRIRSAFGVTAGVYISSSEDELSLPISCGVPGQKNARLHLKNSGFLSAKDFPYEVGLYDVTASPGQRMQPPFTRPDFSPPTSS